VEFTYTVAGNVVELTSARNPIRVEHYAYEVDDPFGPLDYQTAYLSRVELCPLDTGSCITANQYTYQGGKLDTLTRADGGVFSYAYGSTSTVVTAPGGITTTHAFQKVRGIRVPQSVAGSGCSGCGGGAGNDVTYEYTSHWTRPTARIDALGNRTTYRYGALGELLETTEAAASTSLARSTRYEYLYPAPGRVLLRRTVLPARDATSPAREIEYFYEDSAHPNLVTKKVDRGYTDLTGDGVVDAGANQRQEVVIEYAYLPNGQLHEMLGPGTGQRTELTYWSNGDLKESKRFLSASEALVTTYGNYSADGVARSVTDPNGSQTTSVLDEAGRLVSSTRTVSGQTVTTARVYDRFGNVTSTTLPEQNHQTRVFDGKGRLTDVENDLGEVIHSTYDGFNRKLEDEYRAGNDTVRRIDFEFDPPESGDSSTDKRLVRRVKEIGADHPAGEPVTATSRTIYDELGRRKTSIDASGRSRAFTYDALGRLATVSEGGGTTAYGYDRRDNLTSVTDALGRITSYGYDDWGRVIRVSSPDSGVTLYTYDPATGNLATKKDARNQLASYAYDKLNRLTGVTYAGHASENVT